jgi:hypothetical protein
LRGTAFPRIFRCLARAFDGRPQAIEHIFALAFAYIRGRLRNTSLPFGKKDWWNKFYGWKIEKFILHTPFISWFMKNVTILPEDQVVFQMGEQIVLLDLNSRKIGFISKGIGPVVVYNP